MLEKRRHQRIRFDEPLPMKIGHHGARAAGALENLSLGGLMFRTGLPLSVGETIGCEFRVFASPLIDLAAVVASRVGAGLYGARFQAGPMSRHLIDDAINDAIDQGKAGIVSLHELPGGRVMRVTGALTAGHRNDFMHGVERVGVVEIDLAGVTLIDAAGLALCRLAIDRFGVRIARRSPCVEAVWPPSDAFDPAHRP